MSAETDILAAWQAYRRVEKYGLAFGKVCFTWQQKLKERGKRTKGRGVVPILEQLNIPISTAYFWINRYKDHAGLKAQHPAKPQCAMPAGVFRILYADPPWDYGSGPFSPRQMKPASDHYPTMELEAICTMKLPTIADNAVLFLWSTAPKLAEALTVVSAWSFSYKASFVWDKCHHNWGSYNSVQHELLLIATRGSCTPDCPKLIRSIVSIPKTEHSRKPQEFREIIDRLYPHGNRIELFARGSLPAPWHGWGYEFREADKQRCAD